LAVARYNFYYFSLSGTWQTESNIQMEEQKPRKARRMRGIYKSYRG
jgi:hypothetical protein